MEICNMSQIVCVRICLWVLIQCLEMIPLYKPCQFMYCGQRNGYNIIFFMQSCSSYFMAARMLWVKPINNHLQLWLYEPCIKKNNTHTHTLEVQCDFCMVGRADNSSGCGGGRRPCTCLHTTAALCQPLSDLARLISASKFRNCKWLLSCFWINM